MNYRTTILSLSLFLGLFAIFFFGNVDMTYAQQGGYQPLVGIPNVSGTATEGVGGYLNNIYLLIIVVGAMIAVIKIAFAGFQWALSDIVTKKSDAKEAIEGSLLGLLILLGTYVVLYEINPQLTSLEVLKNLRTIQTAPPSVPTPTLASGEIALSGLSAAQKTAAINQCDQDGGQMREYFSGSASDMVMCCDTGGTSCNLSSARVIQNSLNIDTSKVYTPEEFNDMYALYEGRVVETAQPTTCGGPYLTIRRREDSATTQVIKPTYLCVIQALPQE